MNTIDCTLKLKLGIRMLNIKIILINALLISTPILSSLNIRTLPWLTEEAIVFLDQFCKNNKDAKILEFGCGASTIWLSKRTNNLITIEHDKIWCDSIANLLNHVECNTVDLKLIPRPYYSICETFPDNYFDLILVDGRDRVKCIQYAINKVRPGGVLMLDNAERKYYQPAFDMLKDWTLNETEQLIPDQLGFWYQGWKTNWWIKPIK